MGDTTYLKENLQGFVPTPTAAEIIADVVRGSSVMRLSKVQQGEARRHDDQRVCRDSPVHRRGVLQGD